MKHSIGTTYYIYTFHHIQLKTCAGLVEYMKNRARIGNPLRRSDVSMHVKEVINDVRTHYLKIKGPAQSFFLCLKQMLNATNKTV